MSPQAGFHFGLPRTVSYAPTIILLDSRVNSSDQEGDLHAGNGIARLDSGGQKCRGHGWRFLAWSGRQPKKNYAWGCCRRRTKSGTRHGKGTAKRRVAIMFAGPALQPLPIEPLRYYQGFQSCLPGHQPVYSQSSPVGAALTE